MNSTPIKESSQAEQQEPTQTEQTAGRPRRNLDWRLIRRFDSWIDPMNQDEREEDCLFCTSRKAD